MITTKKLASIEIVSCFEPIEEADLIQIAKVKGWRVIVRKDQGIQAGDKGVYIEIDSFLPVIEPFLFLQKTCYKKDVEGNEGFRLKTARMKGEYSQGLFLPLQFFRSKIPDIDNLPVGTDVTGKLGIVPYNAYIPKILQGTLDGAMPAWIRKTDQSMIQNLWDDYSVTYKDVSFEATEKIDGTSATFYRRDGEKGVCGRNYRFKESNDNIYWKMARKIGILDTLDSMNVNAAVQGELAGLDIHGDPLGLKTHRFFVFDIWNIDKQRYLLPSERMDMMELLEISGRIEHVPIIKARIKPFLRFKNVEEIIMHAEGRSMLNPKKIREGIVFKSHDLFKGQTISFKAKSRPYMLKYETSDE